MQIEIPAGNSDATALRSEFGTLVFLEVAARTDKWGEVRGVAQSVLDRSAARPGIMLTLGQQAAQNQDVPFVDATVDRLLQSERPDHARQLQEAMALLRAAEAASEASAPPLWASFFIRTLGWGRAYEVLTPFLSPEAATATGNATTIAEVAFRAGDRTTAERILLVGEDPGQVQQRFRDWSLTMQWEDRPWEEGQRELPNKLLQAMDRP
jgi:hypothetical protein